MNVDWDFINLLGDGHTGITFPMEIMQGAEYYSMLPVYLVKIGDEFTILSVDEEYKDTIPMFSTLMQKNCTGYYICFWRMIKWQDYSIWSL